MNKRFLPVVIAAAFAASVAATPARAQHAPLPLGTVTDVSQISACPGEGFLPGMSCFHAQMSCPNTDELGFTYGYADAAGKLNGTIVLLEGGSGTSAVGGQLYARQYLDDGFRVVQIAWDTAWELASHTANTSIRDAGCRPATFLNYISQTLYTDGGMCAQGDSAGAGALGYALAWYGAGALLDNVEFLSGPVFGDIEQGCVVPNAPVSTVCPPGQYGCDGAPWPDSPSYVGGNIHAIDEWTEEATCNDGQTTTKAANQRWKAMSIVDGTDNPSFSYPQTAIAGWLCSNVDTVQNNSAAQGEFFFDQFTSFQQTAGYSLTRIDNCNGAEGVNDGTTPQGVQGLAAITLDMANACFGRHGVRKRD